MLILRTYGPGRTAGAYLLSIVMMSLSCGTLCSAARAPSLDRTLSELHHTSWTAKDGVPGNILALAQTTDGYLWLGGANGLYRFDGMHFEAYKPPDREFPAHVVECLFATPDGGLFIGFRDGGASLLTNGKVTTYGEQDGMPPTTVRKFARTLDGTVWAATNAGLFRLVNSRWQSTGKDWNFLSPRAQTVFVDRGGTLWVAGSDSVVYVPSGERRFRQAAEPFPGGYHDINALLQAPDGTIWIGETNNTVRPIMIDSPQKGTAPRPEILVGSYGVIFDDAGGLWIGSLGDGIGRVRVIDRLSGRGMQEFPAAAEIFSQKDGLSSDFVSAVLEDREGNIWVGTNAGLDRFRETSIVPSGLPPGSSDVLLIPGDHGDLFTDALNRELTHIDGRSVVEMKKNEDYGKTCGYRGIDGTLWLGGPKGIQHITSSGPARNVPLPKGIRSTWVFAITPGRRGELWASINRSNGVYRLSDGEWTHFGKEKGLPDGWPANLYTDSDGRIWFGYAHGKLVSFDGTTFHTFSATDGIVLGDVMAVYEHGPHLWIGGQFGLQLYDGQGFHKFDAANAGRFNGISGIVETSDGDLWMNAEDVIVHVPAAEVRHALSDSHYGVHSDAFNYLDGLPGTSAGLRVQPTAVQGSDGRIWFSVGGGVVWILPSHVIKNSLPPPVSISSVSANGREYFQQTGFDLPARTTGIRIAYEGLSLTVPERVRFRYKLDGVDQAWQDPGARREAFYTNLSPGQYHFQVVASNNDGVWNEEGARLDFNIAPAWYQTRWFLLLCLAATMCFVWAIYLWRVRSLTARLDMQFQERLSERTRIAHDLHDTLLQEVLSASMQLNVANDQLAKDSPAKLLVERVLGLMGRAVDDGRNAVRGLRPSGDGEQSLEQALARVPQELELQGTVDYRLLVEGSPRPLHPLVRDEAYRIGREAIVNAFRHSGATGIDVALEYGAHELRLHVSDNGRGIDPQVLQSGREGHWGLSGMRERAERAGAKLRVLSSVEHGTEVDLRVPGHIAFESRLSRTASKAS